MWNMIAKNKKSTQWITLIEVLILNDNLIFECFLPMSQQKNDHKNKVRIEEC
jgi:hypothetical protein